MNIQVLQSFAACVAKYYRTWDAAFRGFDSNNSGVITRSEFTTQCRRLPSWQGSSALVFELLDARGTQELREEEFEVLHTVFDEFIDVGVKGRVRDHHTHTVDTYKLVQPLLEPTTYKKHSKDVLRTLEFAFKRGSSPHDWLGPGTPLRAAVEANHCDLALLLLRYGADPNGSRCEKGVSLLHIAAHRNFESMAQLLLAFRGDVNALDVFSQSPMCFAPTRSMCGILFEGRADLALLNHRGQSALHLSCQAGRADVAHWLASKASRALVDLRDAHGFKAVDHARSSGIRLEVLQALAGPQAAQGVAPILSMLEEELDDAPEGEFYGCLARQLEDVPLDVEIADLNRMQLKAVVRVQAWLRGFLARREIREKQEAAVKVQARIRSIKATKELEKQKAAVQKIQAVQRGKAVRREVEGQLRDVFITDIFCALDVSGTGHLSSEALLRYTTICGFDGNSAEWDEEYLKLCERYSWDPDLGPDRDGFAEHLNDVEHHGHMEDHELRIVYDELLEETPLQES